MRTLVEGTDHRRCPQWVKLSDDDVRRAHEMKCNGATFEELRRHFRVRAAGSTWDRGTGAAPVAQTPGLRPSARTAIPNPGRGGALLAS
jgi:hypothetical protein